LRRSAAIVASALFGASCGLGPTGDWRTAAAPPVLISGLGATVALPDDRVGIFGDVTTSTGQPVARTLIFDATQNEWRQGTAIPEPRFGEVAVALKDGHVLFAGGFGQSTQFPPPVLKTSYLYDPTRDSWRQAGDLTEAIAGAEAILLLDGRVLAVGGADSPVAEVFDPDRSTWSSVAIDRSPSGAVLAPLPGGGALLAGGCTNNTPAPQTATAVGAAEVFDGTTGTWRLVQSMPEPRCGATGVSLPDGRVLVIGGWAQAGSSLQDAVVFDPKSNSWIPAGQIAGAESTLGAATLQGASLSDHRVFVALANIGQRSGGLTAVVVGGQLYDPSTSDWSFVTSTSAETSLRFGLPQVVSAVPLRSDRVLVLLANEALIFDANASPPQGALLDSSSLTELLLAIAGALLLLIGIAYAAGMRRRSPRGD